VLASLVAVAYGFNYHINVFPGMTCTGTQMATVDANQINGTACATVAFGPVSNGTNTTNGTQMMASFTIICNIGVNAESVEAYVPSMFYPNNNCSSLFGGAYNNNNFSASAAVANPCQNFAGLANYSFQFVKNGGSDSCSGLYAFEKLLSGVFCISGDTVLPTLGGSVLAKDLEVGTPILTPQGDFKPVQVFWHRIPEPASCLRVCSKATQDCVTVSHEHLIRSSKGFETASTLSKDEFSLTAATCDGLVSFYVEGGAFVTQQGGLEVSCFSKTWGMGHDALVWFTEWSGVLMLPVSDWTVFADTSRCLSKGLFACVFGSVSKLW